MLIREQLGVFATYKTSPTIPNYGAKVRKIMRITKFMHKFTEEEKENIEFRQVYITKLSIWLLFLGIPQKKLCI